jgi:type I restriction enzyme S subunit
MMWFTRSEFDREACFHAVGGVFEVVDREDSLWKLFTNTITWKQQEVVKEYNIIQTKIALNNQLITKLEETARYLCKTNGLSTDVRICQRVERLGVN